MHTPNKNLLDKDWLKEQYEIKQKSFNTIASELKVTVPIVAKYARRYNLTIRSAGESKSLTAKILGPKTRTKIVNDLFSNKDWLHTKYVVEGLSTRDIVNLVGLKNRRTVKRALLAHGIPLRDLKEARNNRTRHKGCARPLKSDIANKVPYIVAEYTNGRSMRSLRLELNISRDAIYKILKNTGIYLRDCNEANIGKHHSDETKRKMSATAVQQIIDGIRSSHGNGKRVTCLTPNDGFVVMRSSWEKKYAEYLKKNNIDFRYEGKSFLLSNSKSYIADFYLTTTDEYIEIKGYLSQDQSDKYALFRQEYPNIKWKMFYKENLLDLGIDLSLDIPTIYLLVGAPASGKSWVANQLLDQFEYISYDGNSKKDHIELLKAPSIKPKLYDPCFKIGTIIRRHSDDFNFILVVIHETEEVLKGRMESRGGTWTHTIMKRNEQVKKRHEKYGAGGFIGSSEECLEFLKNELLQTPIV